MTEGICPKCGQALPDFVPTPLERCVECGSIFTQRAKPKWLFASNYVLRGRVHIGCSFKYDDRLLSRAATPERARRWVWGYRIPNTDVALLFWESPEGLEELLAWWQQGPRNYSAETITELRQALEKAECQYREEFPELLAEEGRTK